MRALGKEYGFRLIFITPVRFLDGKLVLLELYNPPSDAVTVDAFSSFKQFGNELDEFFFDDCHLTPAGHRLLANILLESILAHKLIHEQIKP